MVLSSTDLRVMNPKAIIPFFSGREAEICYFEFVLLIKKQIFRLEVTVDDACSVVQIFDGAKKLKEVVASESLIEPALLVPNLDERE